jgi:hypothetical protein
VAADQVLLQSGLGESGPAEAISLTRMLLAGLVCQFDHQAPLR